MNAEEHYRESVRLSRMGHMTELAQVHATQALVLVIASLAPPGHNPWLADVGEVCRDPDNEPGGHDARHDA
jgi:hypothetical protein